ncbi:MAG: CocE/NonD family hydrolase C-terminal non-catalytic domain-containing protein, partial [Actinomycetota bacterium]
SAAWISCAGHLPFGQPDDQREDDALSLTYDWGLEEGLEILGHPRLVVRVGASAPVAFLSAKLCDVLPDGTSTLVARGLLNLTRRRSLTEPEPMRPGVVEEVELELDATSWVFPAGHRLRLSLAGADYRVEWPEATVATSARLDLRGDADAFEVQLDLEAREGDQVRWTRSWHRRIPRHLA